MASSRKRICWDACSWIALIQREQIRNDSDIIVEDRYSHARSVIEQAEKGKIEIAISGLCLVEVNKPSSQTKNEQLISYFENEYILFVPVDKQIATHARKLMFDSYPGIKPPDATHIATALISNSDEMHTFDERILALDGKLTKLDGTALKICKPGLGGPPLPLLTQVEEEV